jgi:hypothetical protein
MTSGIRKKKFSKKKNFKEKKIFLNFLLIKVNEKKDLYFKSSSFQKRKIKTKNVQKSFKKSYINKNVFQKRLFFYARFALPFR